MELAQGYSPKMPDVEKGVKYGKVKSGLHLSNEIMDKYVFNIS